MSKILPAALTAQDQPTIDAVNTYIVSYAARQAGLKVALSGLGGDELFGGYSSFSRVPLMTWAWRALGPLRPPLARVLAQAGPFAHRSAKLIDLLESPGDLVSSYLVRRRLFSSRQVRSLLAGDERRCWTPGLRDSVLREAEELVQGRAAADAVGLLEMELYMGHTLLRDSDVMGMAHGLEIRLPFLDADFADRALALEPHARAPSRVPKARLVEALGGALPRDIVMRRKRGFTLPFKEWMLHELRDEVRSGIEALARTGEPFKADGVRELMNAFFQAPEKVGWARPWSLFVLGRYLTGQGLLR